LSPYPHKFDRTHSITQIVQQFSTKTAEELEKEQVRVRVAGRVTCNKQVGKAAFIRFSDGVELLQVYIKSNEVDETTWALLKLLDLGDPCGK
jgi:lysyl-tRNA synthetase class 2